MTAPDIILELLAGPRGLDDRAAYLRVDRDGRVTHAGGRLDRFFADVPRVDDPTHDWPWLQTLSTPGEVEAVEIRPRRWADILTRPGDEGALWVLLTEARAPIEKMQAILQETQALTLQARDLLLLGDALTTLDAVALIPGQDFQFRVIGRTPGWFRQIFPDCSARPVDLASTWTFLETFRADAESVWTAHQPGHARSGLWTEAIQQAEALPLEATALRTIDGDRILILQRMAERFSDQQRTLQQARDLNIQHQHLIKEIEKKEILLHCIVHDLGSPLGAIVACLDSVLPAVAEQPDLKALVEIGLRQARRQDSLISQLLDVFRADLDALIRFTPPGDSPDVRKIVLDQVEAQAPLAKMHGVVLRKSVPAEAVFVSATGSRLVRVLANLLDNAIRHSGRDTAVEVRLKVAADTVRLEIQDEGPGVPKSIQPVLFNKLYQGPAGGKAGLGLYFCHMMTERWGGQIGYQPGQRGACFWVRLPRVSQSTVPPP